MKSPPKSVKPAARHAAAQAQEDEAPQVEAAACDALASPPSVLPSARATGMAPPSPQTATPPPPAATPPRQLRNTPQRAARQSVGKVSGGGRASVGRKSARGGARGAEEATSREQSERGERVGVAVAAADCASALACAAGPAAVAAAAAPAVPAAASAPVLRSRAKLDLRKFPSSFQSGAGAEQLRLLHAALSASAEPLTAEDLTKLLPAAKVDDRKVLLLLEVMAYRSIVVAVEKAGGARQAHAWRISD